MRRVTLLLAVIASGAICTCKTATPGGGGTVPPTLPSCGDATVQVTLKVSRGRCKASVTPERACVDKGRVIRWTIDNQCERDLEPQNDKPALAISKVLDKKSRASADWFARSCKASLDRVVSRSRDGVISCTIPKDVLGTTYKYSIEGSIDPLDPDIEVRPRG